MGDSYGCWGVIRIKIYFSVRLEVFDREMGDWSHLPKANFLEVVHPIPLYNYL